MLRFVVIPSAILKVCRPRTVGHKDQTFSPTKER